MADVLDIIMEGLDESVYREIAKSLIGATKNLQESNHVIHAGFDEADVVIKKLPVLIQSSFNHEIHFLSAIQNIN